MSSEISEPVTIGLVDSKSRKPTAKRIMSNNRVSIIPFTLFAALFFPFTVRASEPSFRRDVMPLFFRAGCNSGTCHGSARGKDGFMLSLFGYDAKGDYERVVNEMIGRRVNIAVAEQSLLLLKATGAVPHTGGKLFSPGSDYYKTDLEWIEAGAPDDIGQIPSTVEVVLSRKCLMFEKPELGETLTVTAKASDGSTRDVTRLARFFSNNDSVARIDSDGRVTAVGPGDTNVFARFSRFTVGVEVIVLPPAAGFQWPDPVAVNFIDELVFDRLKKLRVAPSDLCDDETFLRRVSLDLIARPPTLAEYRDFMADTRSDKRAIKIDQLLDDDAFADFWTALWAEQLRVIGGNYAPVATDVKSGRRLLSVDSHANAISPTTERVHRRDGGRFREQFVKRPGEPLYDAGS